MIRQFCILIFKNFQILMVAANVLTWEAKNCCIWYPLFERLFDSYFTWSGVFSCYYAQLSFFVMSCIIYIYLVWDVTFFSPYTGGPSTFCSVLCKWPWHFVTSCKDGGTTLRLCWYQFWVIRNSLCCYTDFYLHINLSSSWL